MENLRKITFSASETRRRFSEHPTTFSAQKLLTVGVSPRKLFHYISIFMYTCYTNYSQFIRSSELKKTALNYFHNKKTVSKCLQNIYPHSW